LKNAIVEENATVLYPFRGRAAMKYLLDTNWRKLGWTKNGGSR
jgi:hypothetical protein